MEPCTESDWEILADSPAISIAQALCLSLDIHPSATTTELIERWVNASYKQYWKRYFAKLVAGVGEEHALELRARHDSCWRWACVAAPGGLHTYLAPDLRELGTGHIFAWCCVRPLDFATFCVRQDWAIPEQLAVYAQTAEPVAESDGRVSWPWGGYETELLRHLAAAAQRYWVRYDPSDPTTAQTNEEVAAFLVGRGVSGRVAETMAQILRADGLRPGPRPGAKAKD